MGLLDWLGDALGGLSNAATDPSTMGATSSAGTPPVASDAQMLANPPIPQQPPTGDTPPAIPMPQSSGGIGSDAARAPGQPPIPPLATPPVTPPTAPMGAPPHSAVPAVTPPTGPSMNIAPPVGGSPEVSGTGPAARSFLGRAIGLDANNDRGLMSSLGAGLTAAGNSAGKSKFQAFAGGAGAALEGAEKADDKTTANQQKYLTQAIEAMKAGDSRQANLALTQLRQAQTQMTLQGKGGKDSVLNSDQQLYLRGLGAIHSDPAVTASAAGVRAAQTQYGPDSPQAKAAMDAHNKLISETKQRVLGTLGVDEKTFDKIGEKPGMSERSAIPKEKMNSQEAFDKLPPGAFFVNPKDGKILQKPMVPVQQPGQQPAAAPAGAQNLPVGQGGVPSAQPASNLPPLPPRTPQASMIPGIGADEDADAKEPA